MGFESVRFFNFRNLKDRELALGAKEVFLIGENGQGKTNLLEALYLLCVASSFRENRDAPLMRDPAREMGLFGLYRDGENPHMTLSLQIAPEKKKEIMVDGKPVSERKDLLGQVLCICMVQQDMDFVGGPPEAKRRFFDQTLLLSDPSFFRTIRDYRRVLRSRNFVLKSRQAGLLDTYDLQLAALGLEISARRHSLVTDFNGVFSPLFKEVTGGDWSVGISYEPSWRGREVSEVLKRLNESRGRDLALGVTTCGPHRDSFVYSRDGNNFSPFASTGQLRLCALILRMAQALYLTRRTGKKPVFLIDDVLLELDPGRKKALISRFPPYEQAVFTFLPDENYLSYRGGDTLVLRVERGDFTA